jgi:hypothetical protein
MHAKVGIVAFAFGLRTEAQEPNPSNIALAKAVDDAAYYVENQGGMSVIVTQWEITKGLELLDMEVDLSVGLHTDGTYLNSNDVWEAAKAEFISEGVEEVIVIAQPFLHLPKLKAMVRNDGFEVAPYFKVGPIPFDNSPLNTQPWTRTRPALMLYSVKSLLGMKRGHDGMQNAT